MVSQIRGRRGPEQGDLTDEIKKEEWTLNISRYVLPPLGEDIPPLPDAVAEFKRALAEARAAEDYLRTVLTEEGWLE